MKNYICSFLAIKKIVIFFLAATLLCGISSKAQVYRIEFPNAPPPTSDPSLDQNDNPASGIVFGVKFYVTKPGYVHRIYFYKGDNVTGTHEGNLWKKTRPLGGVPGNCNVPIHCGPGANGQLNEVPAPFTETASGWQEAIFVNALSVNSPIHITPADTIIASIWSSNGDYGEESNTWAGGTDFGADPNPIRVLAVTNDPTGLPPGNGVAVITNGNQDFPSASNFAPNYWVDILFAPDPPLPASLSDFRAATMSKDILLSWKTLSENNNRGFEVQRSNNGTDWYPLSFVNGAGESSITRNYSYTDKALSPGTYYYRLNQVDIDGRSKLSNIVIASVSGKGQVSLFSPNPFTNSDVIRFDLPRAQRARLSIFDMTGREIKVLTDNSRAAGTHLVNLSTAGLSRQLYYIRLNTDDGVITKTILVQ